MTDSKVKESIQRSIHLVSQALGDLRQLYSRLDSGDVPEVLDVADVASSLSGATTEILSIAPHLD